MRLAFDVATVRAAENNLLAQQSEPDQLMRLAADAVASTAARLLDAQPGSDAQGTQGTQSTQGTVMILAGPGGNGGDGLYAGAALARAGRTVYALVPETCHQPALDAFLAAGGQLTDALPKPTDLLIDAVAGLGSARGLDGAAAEIYAKATGLRQPIPVLAVDVPTGIDAQTGRRAGGDNAGIVVEADATVSFGWARAGHVHAPECGRIILTDLALPGAERTFAQELEHLAAPMGHIANEPSLPAIHPRGYEWTAQWTPELKPVGCTGPIVDPTPGLASDKYTGGVVGICAGSPAYPGAGILAASAAVRATPAMVRVIAHAATAAPVLAATPEVVVHPSVADAGRVQAWLVGPGRGTDDAARAELAELLTRPEPLVIDADAVTLLAADAALRDAVRARHGRDEITVLTPHAGEFARLYSAAFGNSPDESRSRGDLARELAVELGAYVVLKGRITTVTGPESAVCRGIFGVNTGNSYAATPGSGDVLGGIVGALLAQGGEETHEILLHAVALHAHAAAVAAETPEGFAPTSAGRIADAIPQATARLMHMNR